jgi:hypothetical protein
MAGGVPLKQAEYRNGKRRRRRKATGEGSILFCNRMIFKPLLSILCYQQT